MCDEEGGEELALSACGLTDPEACQSAVVSAMATIRQATDRTCKLEEMGTNIVKASVASGLQYSEEQKTYGFRYMSNEQ